MGATLKKDISIYDLVNVRRKKFPSSGEINFNENPEKCLQKIDENYTALAHSVDRKDGISLSFGTGALMFASQIRSLVRLNPETG